MAKKLSSSKKPRFLSVLSLLLLLAVLVVVVIAVKYQQDNRSKAATGAIPQGLYESCEPNNTQNVTTGDSNCYARLDQMAAGGFSIVINYDQMDRPIEMQHAYAAYAASKGMKVIWAMNDPIWWTGNASSQYGDLMTSCTNAIGSGNCNSSVKLASWFVGEVKNDPGTWGYYIGDEVSNAPAAMVTYSNAIHSTDPNHPRLFVGSYNIDDCTSNKTALSILSPFVNIADDINLDIYTIGAGEPLQDVQACSNKLAQYAASLGKQWSVVLQAHDAGVYNDGEKAGWPTVSDMTTSKNYVIQAGASYGNPSMILWYSYFDVINGGTTRWNNLVNAAAATGGVISTPFPTNTLGPTRTVTATLTPRPTIGNPTSVPATPTPIVQQPVTGDQFGYTKVGSSTDPQVGQQISAVKVSLANTKYANGISVYVRRVPVNGTQIAGAIYKDNNGKPGQLIWGGSAQQSNSTGWQTLVVPHLQLSAGNYWIAFNASKLNTSIAFSSGLNPTIYSYQTWIGSLSWPTTAPSATINSWTYSMYLIAQ